MRIVRRLGRIGIVDAASRGRVVSPAAAAVLTMRRVEMSRLDVTLYDATDLPLGLSVVVASSRSKAKLTLVVEGEALSGQLVRGNELLNDVDVTAATEDAGRLRGEDKLVQVLTAALGPGRLSWAQCG